MWANTEQVQQSILDGEIYRELSDRMIEQSDTWSDILNAPVIIWFSQKEHMTYTGFVVTRDMFENQWDYQVTVRAPGCDPIDFGTLDAALEWMEKMFAEELEK
jgi:hypothetical protein